MLKPLFEVEVAGRERAAEVVAVERSGDADDEAREHPRDRALDRHPDADRPRRALVLARRPEAQTEPGLLEHEGDDR